jgi:2,5-dihydroxypyridine 5,6-dioxygenase
VLLCDPTVSPALREGFAAAGWSLGADVVEVAYQPRERVAMREFGRFAAASHDTRPRLPAPATQALAAADSALILNADMSIMFDAGLRAVISEGATKLAWAPYLDEESALRLLPASPNECHELQAATVAVGSRLAAARRVRVTSPGGTELDLDIGEHRINCGTGIATSGAGYGGLEIWPGGQVSTVPDPGSARGRLVVDRSINAPRFAELTEPIELTIENGDVVRIDGRAEATELRGWLRSLDDPQTYHLTELGVGTNDRCRLAGVAAPCEDTHTRGCVSFALGADIHLGGRVAAPCHVDMTLRNATLVLDGAPLVADGVLDA